MAYAWDRTLSLLGGQDEQQQPGQSQNVLSSSDGEIAGGPSPSAPSGPQAPTAQQTTSTPTAGSKSAVMKRNAGKSQAPADLGKMAGTVTGARQSLQNEANAYVQGADDPEEAQTAQAGQAVKQFAETGQKADWLDALNSKRLVSGPDLKTSTKVEDINLLENDAGIRELFRRQQDPEGTIGEASLDTALLRGNQDFARNRDALMKDYGALQSERMKMPEELRRQAQSAVDKAAEARRLAVMGEAEKLAANYDTIAKQREAEFDAQLASLEAARRAQLEKDAQAEIQAMIDSGSYNELAPYLSTEGLDLGQYYTPGMTAENTSWEQFYGEPEAQGFERLMGLLGKGDTRAVGSLAGKSAQDALGGGFTPRGREEMKQKAIEAAAGRAAEAKAAQEAEAARVQAKKDRALQTTLDQYAQMDADFAERNKPKSERKGGHEGFGELAGYGADPLAAAAAKSGIPLDEQAPFSPGNVAKKATSATTRTVNRWLGR